MIPSLHQIGVRPTSNTARAMAIVNQTYAHLWHELSIEPAGPTLFSVGHHNDRAQCHAQRTSAEFYRQARIHMGLEC